MSRFARHKDTAHRPTVVALRAAGASVEAMDLKDGPDLLVGHNGTTLLMEVKTRATNTKKDGHTRNVVGKLSTGQEAWHAAWKGGRVLTVYGPEEALVALGLDMHEISNLRVLTNGWKKDIATKPSHTYGKERPFRPGTDKARTIAEMCGVAGCVTSRSPGMGVCAPHAAEEF